jgi:hypothetical protein
MFEEKKDQKKLAFLVAAVFLVLYWLYGFDGITFSDDVYYLLAGKGFWEGKMVFNDYHFSTRWGTYIPAGLVGKITGFDPHWVSMISLISYLVILWLLIKILPNPVDSWILVFWLSTQVFYLHFLTKIYPDSILALWTCLIPFAATFRNKRPFWAAFGLVSGVFLGFITKETIVYLLAFPALLYLVDRKKNTLNPVFYAWLMGIGVFFIALYLGYFWIEFGNPLYRFESIQNGHYISEYTFADKSSWVMLKRLTVLPIINLVERAYWPWIIFAIAGVMYSLKKVNSPGMEFSLAFLSLLMGFWFMSTSLRLYNPIHLNPRHLIILVPILSFLIALGWNFWQTNTKVKRLLTGMLLLGILISMFQNDYKMIAFQSLFLLVLLPTNLPFQKGVLAFILLVPAIFASYHQQGLKAYPSLLKHIKESALNTNKEGPVLANNFIEFSKEVLLDSFPELHQEVIGIEKIDSLKTFHPEKLQVLLYDYYQHAYPQEQADVDKLEFWLDKEYELIKEKREGPISIRFYKLRVDH